MRLSIRRIWPALVIGASLSCWKAMAGITSSDVVGTFATERHASARLAMDVRFSADGTFVVTCRMGGEQTLGNWRIFDKFLRMEPGEDGAKGTCSSFLPVTTSGERVSGRLRFVAGTEGGDFVYLEKQHD